MFRQQAELYGSKPPTAPDLWCLPFIIKNMQKNGVKLMRFINNILKIDEFKITANM